MINQEVMKTNDDAVREVNSMPAEIQGDNACINLESVNRISKLPMVESTVQTSKNIYEKVKDYNSLTNWTISTAEQTVSKAMEVGKPYAVPMVHTLEGPLKKMDGLICSGLDFVEAKVPAVKLPPAELYESTKEYIANNPTVVSACSVVKPAVDTAKGYVATAGTTVNVTMQGAKNMVEPAFESAKKMVEPAIEQAKHMVEPYIESSMEKASAIKEYGTQRLEEYMHSNPTSTEDKHEDNSEDEAETPSSTGEMHN